jgi:hypothetical protein
VVDTVAVVDMVVAEADMGEAEATVAAGMEAEPI